MDNVSWRDYVDTRLVAVEQTLAATEKALEARLATLNEFRDAMNDQRQGLETRLNKCLSRAEHLAEHKALDDKIGSVNTELSELRGKASMSQIYISYGLALLAVVVSVVSLILK